MRLWPSNAWMMRMSAPFSSRCVAKLWRRVWTGTGVGMPGAAGAQGVDGAALGDAGPGGRFAAGGLQRNGAHMMVFPPGGEQEAGGIGGAWSLGVCGAIVAAQ